MKVDDIAREVRRLADDDQSILIADIQDWIDLGINRINQALQCKIPTIKLLPTTTIPSFDERYHEVLIIFCVAKYREGDSDYQAAQYFQKQFEDMLAIMQRDMPIKPSISADYNYLQLTAATDGQIIFNLTIPYGSYFDTLTVYQNDVDITDYCTFSLDHKQMTVDVSQVTIKSGDAITVKFENNSDLNTPSYAWWGTSGW